MQNRIDTQRAYVEFRAKDVDGGEVITAAIFTYIWTEIVRKARHALKLAAAAT
jgi:hypothetical protein